jgi:hypothetical protein
LSNGSRVADPDALVDRVAIFITCSLDDGVGDPGLPALVAASERSAFEQLEAAMLATMPKLATVAQDHPWPRLQEAALAWTSAMYDAGVRHGAAIETMRR